MDYLGGQLSLVLLQMNTHSIIQNITMRKMVDEDSIKWHKTAIIRASVQKNLSLFKILQKPTTKIGWLFQKPIMLH